MSKKLFIKSINCLSIFALVFFCGINLVLAKENSSVNVESRVSATANSGGNTISGSGTITTGDASASAKSITLVNGGENVKIVTEARAETGGKNSTASVEVNGEKAVCAGDDDGCEVEISSEAELAEEERIFQEEKQIEEAIDLDEVEPEKNFGSTVQNFFSGIVGKIRSWF
ncbi:MAG: hypothetical protein WC848_06410 [Parcubacteria group bacterium]|jgi:hypothetical protein